jgi:hypothetical protein
VAFVGFILKNWKNSGQWLRAFSSGFNQLTNVIHSENAGEKIKIRMVCTMESENLSLY